MSPSMYDLTKNEELILLSVWKLRDNAYGMSIKDVFKKTTGKILNYGSMYNTLFMLVRKGYIDTKEGRPESKRGGRRKVLYSITSEGRRALSHAQMIQNRAWGGVVDLGYNEKND